MSFGYDQPTRDELSLSDIDFLHAQALANDKWWDTYSNTHNRCDGGVYCANHECRKELKDPGDLRPFGGQNYCASCFSKKGERLIKDNARQLHLNPLTCIEIEWVLRVGRVLDRSLVRMAETDEDIIEVD